MFIPDNKFTPPPVTKRDREAVVQPADEKSRRRPPTRSFDEVAEKVDEKNEGTEKTKSKKKSEIGKGEKGENVPLSLFDLSRSQRDAGDEGQKEDDPFVVVLPDADEETKSTEYHHPLFKDFNGASEQATRFGTVEQPDLASVTPLPPPISVGPLIPVSSTIKTESVPLPQSMQDLIDQIASNALILKQSGNTETVVQLEGTFGGSRLIVTESDSAKGQLNITIDNLTGKNQQLLETNRMSLINDLLEKGVHVQNFTASATRETTLIDVATSEQEGQGFQRNPQDNPEDNPRRDGKRQQFDEEETT